MSPADLAQRLAALDWSATSLQHQLAVSAACATLKGFEPMTTMLRDSELLRSNPRFLVPDTDAPSNVTVLPVQKRTCWTTLCHLDGREWARSSHFGPGGAWNWVLETVAHEHSVSEDQIGGIEGDDGCDLVTVDGLPVYRIEHVSTVAAS